jgi:histone-lysine N-methyltransferase SETD3
MTRQNQIPLLSGKQQQLKEPHTTEVEQNEPALIPLWDLCNHEEGRITTFFDMETKYTDFFALTSFAKGEQIKMFYGERPNFQLLIYSGFVFHDNKHDAVKLTVELNKTDPLYQEKSKILLGNETLEILVTRKEGIKGQLIPFYRLDSMNEEELKKFMELLNNTKDESRSHLPTEIVSEENEKKAIEKAHERCKQALTNYPTTLEVRNISLDGVNSNCTFYRMIEEYYLKLLNYLITNGAVLCYDI